MDLILLTLIIGFAVATLIFWPVLNRLRAASAPSGKHALRTSSAQSRFRTSAPARVPATAPAAAEPGEAAEAEVPAEPAEPEAPAAPAETPISRQDTAADRDRNTPEPAHRSSAPSLGVAVPVLPGTLFQEHYEAKFRRTRDRIERLRNQLHEQN